MRVAKERRLRRKRRKAIRRARWACCKTIVDATQHGREWPPAVQARVVEAINAVRRLQGRGEITLLSEAMDTDLFQGRFPDAPARGESVGSG